MSGDRRRNDDRPLPTAPSDEKGLEEDGLGEGLIDIPSDPDGAARDDAPAHHLEDEAAAEALLLGEEEEDARAREDRDDMPFELEDEAFDSMEEEARAIDARDDREGPIDDLEDDLFVGAPELSEASDAEGPSEEGLHLDALPPLPPLDANEEEEGDGVDLEEEDLLDLPEGEDPAPRRPGRGEGRWGARSA